MSVYPDETVPLLAHDEPDQPFRLSKFRLTLLLSTIYFGATLTAVDSTIVSTLLGHIGSDLNALESVSWIAAGYTVAFSAFQPLYGKFSDIWGRRKVCMLSTSLFGIGCYMCGAAGGLGVLVAGRFVSGVGAGGMMSMSTVTLSDYVSLRSRGIFQGIGNVCFGVGASLGSVLGGWFTLYGGWRMAFMAQVPLIVAAVILQYLLLRERPVSAAVNHRVEQRIDWLGSISLVTSLLSFMLAITLGGNRFKWLSWPIAGFLTLSTVLFVLFWNVERRAADPIMPLDILLHRTILNSCLTNAIASGTVYAYIFYCPILLQASFHYSYIVVGHRIVANFIGVVFGSLGAGLIMHRTGKYRALGVHCCALIALGALVLLLSPVVGSLAASPVYQNFSFFLTGLGYAGMITVTMLALVAALDLKFQATTSAALYTFRGAGSSLGIAVASAIFSNVLQVALGRNVGTDTEAKRKIVETVYKSLEAIWDQPEKYVPAIVASYRTAGLAVLAFCFLGSVGAMFTTSLMGEHSLERESASLPDPALRPSTPPGVLVHEP